MASLLKKRGFTQVQVLEKTGRIGGKSFTHVVDGVPHEMGTCYLHPLYLRVKKLLNEYGISPDVKPGGLNARRHINSDHLKGPHGEPLDLGEWMMASIEEEKMPEWMKWAPDKLQALNLLSAIHHYNKLHESILGTYEDSLPPRPSPAAMDQLNMTMMEFLRHHKLEAMIPLLRLSHSAQGYGLLETIPALYGLWWNSPGVMSAFLESGRHPEKPIITMLPSGYEPLWHAIQQKDEIDVRLETDIERIRRSDEGVSITSRQAGQSTTEAFDFLIITSGLQASLEYLDQPSAEEKTLFETLDYDHLVTTLVKAKSSEPSVVIEYWPDVLHPGFPGRLYCMRNSRQCFHPEADFTGSNHYVTYQYLERARDHELEGLERQLLHDLEQVAGLQEVEIIGDQHPWPYFARFTQDGINRGYPWRLFEAQGKMRTWYAGASACFESVHDVVGYNHQIIDRYLEAG
jgi:hypothetical protein